jgi:8-oxo-dGTP pyrophosphatase MutT (NUDIX family)
MGQQSYKIFVNDRLLLLSNKAEKTATSPFFYFFQENQLNEAMKFLQTDRDEAAIVYSSRPKEVFDELVMNHDLILAAGGIVYNSKGEILIIKRLGKWDLPKGKLDKGETFKEAAVREVEEECGLLNVKRKTKLGKTIHTYLQKGALKIKITKWYEMFVDDYSNMKPQTEEGITEIKWVHPSVIKSEDFNTYESLKEFLWSLKL